MDFEYATVLAIIPSWRDAACRVRVMAVVGELYCSASRCDVANEGFRSRSNVP